MKYQVFDGNKPAEYAEGIHRYWREWSNSKFDTLEAAVRYANNWLGNYVKDYPVSASLLLNGYKYNGFDIIQIKEIHNDDQEKPQPGFLDKALKCGAHLTGKPDGSEPVTIVFSSAAWRRFNTMIIKEIHNDV